MLLQLYRIHEHGDGIVLQKGGNLTTAATGYVSSVGLIELGIEFKVIILAKTIYI